MAILHYKTPTNVEGFIDINQIVHENNSDVANITGIKTFINDHPFMALLCDDTDWGIGYRLSAHEAEDPTTDDCRQICIGNNAHLNWGENNIGGHITINEYIEDVRPAGVYLVGSYGNTATTFGIETSDGGRIHINWQYDRFLEYTANNKWFKYGNKLVQWGNATGSSGASIAFPVAFGTSTPALVILASETSVSTDYYYPTFTDRTANGFKLWCSSGSAYVNKRVGWIAVGNAPS